MKKKLMKNILLFFAVILIYSCENSATVEPPPFEKKPVITCLISPKSEFILANLSYTQPYWGNNNNNQFEYILDAKVTIYDLTEGISTKLELDGNTGIYKSDTNTVHIVAMHNYKLEVQLANGKIYTANSTVPPKPEIGKLKLIDHLIGASEFIYFDNSTGFNYFITPISMKLQYAGILGKNFYLSLQLIDSIQNGTGEFLDMQFSQSVDKEIIQGNTYNNLEIYMRREFNFFNNPFSLKSVFGAIYTMDKAYAEFYKTQDFFGGNEPNPFNEPIIPPTNFSVGAIGVFGSYDFETGVFYQR
jgi:hypothetical protein